LAGPGDPRAAENTGASTISRRRGRRGNWGVVRESFPRGFFEGREALGNGHFPRPQSPRRPFKKKPLLPRGNKGALFAYALGSARVGRPRWFIEPGLLLVIGWRGGGGYARTPAGGRGAGSRGAGPGLEGGPQDSRIFPAERFPGQKKNFKTCPPGPILFSFAGGPGARATHKAGTVQPVEFSHSNIPRSGAGLHSHGGKAGGGGTFGAVVRRALVQGGRISRKDLGRGGGAGNGGAPGGATSRRSFSFPFSGGGHGSGSFGGRGALLAMTGSGRGLSFGGGNPFGVGNKNRRP